MTLADVTMTHSPRTPAMSVIAISPTEWRVSDSRRAEDDARSLVGFVQRVGDVFEVTFLRAPGERRFYASYASAMSSLAR
ncbi:MAG: hypothetical protein JWM51_2247 [Microbacteriaceae bacterium]|jgi:hypothetical protein|nr:hypothetical protein [Microbacteriaceae bacterium]